MPTMCSFAQLQAFSGTNHTEPKKKTTLALDDENSGI